MFYMSAKFSNWLVVMMKERGWKQSDLARASGLTPTSISDLITGRRNPGKDSCTQIALALKLPQEIVFREAGILDGEPVKDDKLYKIETLYHTLRMQIKNVPCSLWSFFQSWRRKMIGRASRLSNAKKDMLIAYLHFLHMTEHLHTTSIRAHWV